MNNKKQFIDSISITVNRNKKNFNSAMSYLTENTYRELNKFKNNTKQGYPVKNNFGKGFRQYSVIERPKGTFTSPDYFVANCYDKTTGTWAQGYYDFSTRKEAINFAKKKAYRKY